MLISGVWKDNISCKLCRFRHPAELTCGQAKSIARQQSPKLNPVEVELEFNMAGSTVSITVPIDARLVIQTNNGRSNIFTLKSIEGMDGLSVRR